MLSPTRVYYNRKVNTHDREKRRLATSVRRTDHLEIFRRDSYSEEEQELSQWLATSEKHRREVAELRAVRQRFAKWRSTLYGPARFIRSLNRLNSRIDALENAPCTAQRPHRLSNLFGHIRIHSLLRTAAVVAVVALTGMFAWRTALMPAPITYFNADTTIMHVAMPDGSDIWLTPGSTLCYDETFHTDERRVHLDGEAYFDVEHDAKHLSTSLLPICACACSVRFSASDRCAATTWPRRRWPKAPYHCSAPTAAI